MDISISIISLSISNVSLFISYFLYKKSRSDVSYLNIDNQYSQLLKLAMDDPGLRDYEMTSQYYKLDSSDEFKRKYSIYAYMCWNFLETIFDRQQDSKGRFKLSETWFPVMLEENSLHYAWFKHNLRLFKPEFQDFIVNKLNDVGVLVGTVNDLDEIYPKMKVDFPANEIKSLSQIKMLMENNRYKLLLAKHKVIDAVIGYAFIYEMPQINVV